MPSLYGITGNTTNVAVTNTTGLYQQNGNVNVLNSAQTLLAVLDNNGNVNFALDPATSNTTVYAYVTGNAVPNYSNSNVISLLANLGSNSIATSGNITAGNLTVTGLTNFGNAEFTEIYMVDSIRSVQYQTGAYISFLNSTSTYGELDLHAVNLINIFSYPGNI